MEDDACVENLNDLDINEEDVSSEEIDAISILDTIEVEERYNLK